MSIIYHRATAISIYSKKYNARCDMILTMSINCWEKSLYFW